MAQRQRPTAGPAPGNRKKNTRRAPSPKTTTVDAKRKQASVDGEAKEIEKLLANLAGKKTELAAKRPLIIRFIPWLLAGGLLYWVYFRDKPYVRPDAPNNATATERELAAKAVSAKADREIAAETFEALAILLEQDGKDKEPAIKLREQVSEQLLAETARSLAIVGIVISDKDAFATLASSFFDAEDEFPTKAGALSAEDRAKGVRQIKAFANAFR